MSQAFRSTLWFLFIFVGVAVHPVSLDDIAATFEDLTLRWTDPDWLEVDRDQEALARQKQASVGPTSDGTDGAMAPAPRPMLSLDTQPIHQPAFAALLPTSPARLLSLRL